MDVLAVLFCSVCPGDATWMCWLYCFVVSVQIMLRGWVGCIVSLVLIVLGFVVLRFIVCSWYFGAFGHVFIGTIGC